MLGVDDDIARLLTVHLEEAEEEATVRLYSRLVAKAPRY
jgi:hypothetical protein